MLVPSHIKMLVLLTLFLLGSSYCAMGQTWTLRTHCIDSTSNVTGIQRNNKSFSQLRELIQEINTIVPHYQEQGFLAAAIDSIALHDQVYDIYYFIGTKYQWGTLSFDSIPAAYLIAANINPLQYTQRALNPKSIAQICERLLQHAEENGYPFAQLYLTEIKNISPQNISAQVHIDRGSYRRIDSIIINGEVKIANSFMQRYLDILQGSVYNEKKLKSISQRLRELAFIEESSPWVINFRPGDTRLSLFLKEKKANQLNAILGVMPNNLQVGKLLLTADMQIALQNLLGYGESISASYQNLQARSPRLKADLIIPYIMHSPIGLEAHFDLFRNDLQFRKVNFQTGIRYALNARDLIRFYVQTMSNRIINIDTPSIIAQKQLPANIDVRVQGIGIEINLNRTDYKLNPHKGWYIRSSATAFTRKVLKNNAITGLQDGSGFNYSSLYDSVNNTQYLYHIQTEAATFLPIGKDLSVKLAYQAAYIAAPHLFQNELFQIGGFKILRGFDEQSIFANQYHIAVSELRLKLNPNSYAYIFSDNGWVQSKFNNYNRAAWYNGFGLGTTLQTKTGIFSIALGYGRNDFHPLRIKESKLSFGYVALF
jgi:outer membrane protein assembly factor BamA